MGYYSSLYFEGNSVQFINEKKLEMLNNILKENYTDKEVAWVKSLGFDNMDFVYGFYGAKFYMDEYGLDVEVEEWNAKFYDDREIAILLADTITDGYCVLEFTGEEGERWGYKILPNIVQEMECVMKVINEFVVKQPN